MTGQEEKVLDLLRTHLMTSERRHYDHMATTFRWLMATLFAANGGAAIALLQIAPQADVARTALGWFAAGVFLSILMGLLSSFWGHRASIRVTTARFKIERVMLEGAMNPDILADISAETQLEDLGAVVCRDTLVRLLHRRHVRRGAG